MPRFFIDHSPKKQTVITGEDGKNIAKSLRMQIGEPLTLCDGKGTDYHGIITSIEQNQITVTISDSCPTVAEPTATVTLYQSLPKSDKMDTVVQKAIEMGVTRIVPVLSMRCISRPDEKTAQKKTQRWQKIAIEAAKQSERGVLPTVTAIMDFATAMRQAAAKSTVLFFYEGGGESLQGLIQKTCSAYSIFIGPEGGFSPEEVALAMDLGAKKTTLGPRILRTETAPIAALSAIMLLTDNM